MAGGVSSSQSWSSASVRALASDGKKLFVVGTFDSAGSGDGAIAASGVAVLDLGTGSWETYDGGLRFASDPGEARALALVGDRLYVGGSFDHAGTVETASFAALNLVTGSWEGFGAGVRNGEWRGTAGRAE